MEGNITMEAVIAAMVVIAALVYNAMLRIQILKLKDRVENLEELVGIPESRCSECADRETCPAAYTGVCYPCEHFRKEDSNEETRK